MSRPARDAWIETIEDIKINDCLVSRPARDAWIETADRKEAQMAYYVASRTGRVD